MGPIHIRFGGYQPPTSVHNQGAEVLGKKLTERLGESVRFELEGNVLDSGHKAADLLRMVENGEKNMCYFSTSYLAERVPEFALFDLPFMIDQREKAYAAMDGTLGQLLAEKVRAETGYRLLGLWDNGFRHLSNRYWPIRKPSDCRGMSIRTLFSELHIQVFKLLGFDPRALDVKDLIASVQEGTIDAQENPLTNIYKFGIHKYHRHITLSRHFFGAAALLCHNDSYESWPDEFREVLSAAVTEATMAQRQFAAAEDEEILAKLTTEEIAIVELSKDERAAFKAVVAPVLEEQRKRFGDELFGSFA